MRIALFGSFYRGFHVLKELLEGELKQVIQIVGVATDDPDYSFISPHKRVWQYPHTKEERLMVRDLAKKAGIEAYTGRVKTDTFYQLFENQWKPDICIMATFGQLISPRLFNFPKLGFYNFHPCYDEKWPSYVGGNPFKALIEDKRKHAVIAMHHVDENFDTGKLVSFSERVSISEHTTIIDMHRATAPVAAKLAVQEIKKILTLQNKIVKNNFYDINTNMINLSGTG